MRRWSGDLVSTEHFPDRMTWRIHAGGDERAKRASWTSLVAETIEPVDFRTPDWEGFAASVEHREAGPTPLSLIRSTPWTATTAAEHLSRPGLRSAFMLFMLSGETEINQEGSRATLRAGETAIVDGNRLSRHVSHADSRFMMLRLDPNCAETETLRSASHVHAILDRDDPLAAVVSGLARRTWAALPGLDAEGRARVVNRLRQTATLGVAASDPHGDYISAHKAAMLHRARALVQQRLADPSFSPAKLAKEMGVTQRYLGALFEAMQVSPGDYIRKIRTHVGWDLLRDQDQQTIAEIASAVGFSDQSQFSRVMRLEFGMTPRDIRRKPPAG